MPIKLVLNWSGDYVDHSIFQGRPTLTDRGRLETDVTASKLECNVCLPANQEDDIKC